ncbi:MAG TPA: two-component regulator propeller domain-containing protein, partial [Thermoanaerobaculia bacterium]|nr:two-component regulator propeller domain-containing protein [Thermoanaerobaculia bacterium]
MHCLSSSASRRALPAGSAAAVLLALALAAPRVGAQILPIFNLTTDDGLAASQVWDVLRDRRGYLWIATSEGLTRYDGFELTSITGAEGLRNQVVRRVVEAPDGTLWLATADGLAHYDGRRLSFIGSAEGMRGGIVWDLALDRHGNLWFGTGSAGLGVVVGDKWKQYGKGNGLAGNDVYSLHVAPSGELWVGTRRSGVASCAVGARGELSRCRTFTTADGLAHDSVRAIASDRFGNVWLGTRGGGVSRWDGRRFTNFRATPPHIAEDSRVGPWAAADGLADDDVYALHVRPGGELVIGNAQRGITICTLPDLRPCRTLRKGNGLIVDAVLGVDEDVEGNLWVSLNNGLSKLVSEKLQSFDDRHGVPGPGGYAVLPEPNGDVWVASFGGLGRMLLAPPYAQPLVASWNAERGLPSSEVWDVLRDRRGRLWVATAGGLCLFDAARGCSAVYGEEQGLAGSYVLDLFETKGGDLWVGTLTGASRLRFGDGSGAPEVLSLRATDGLPAAQVQSVAEDAHGTIWFACSGGGLAAFRDGAEPPRVRAWTAAEGLPSENLYGLFAARNGEVWVGTGGSGLVRFRPTADLTRPPAFTRFGPESGIDARAVFAIREDPAGRLWLGTTAGVYHFDPRADNGRGRVLRHFDRSSGLISKDTSTGNSLALDDRGRVWIGFSGGITRYDPALEEPPLPPPRTTLERVALGPRAAVVLRAPFTSPPHLREGERWLDAAAPLALERGQHNLRVDYRGLSYRSPRQVRYQVRLVGFDPDWSAAGTEPFKEYTNLDPGDYRFEVRAALLDGAWGPPATLAVTLQPAFWQTPLFAGAALLAMLLLLGGAHRLRTSRIKQRAS